jgi:dTDP-4-dehydrorhamnose 3,5-epimerase
MPFEFEKTTLDGVILIKPKVFGDSRGFFLETYKKDDFERAGIKADFVQDSQSRSKKGVIRGIHLQLGEFSQSKLIRCIEGKILDVAVDLRKNSKNFGKYASFELSEKNKSMLYLPSGFGHGFVALTQYAQIEYKQNNLYSPEHESGVLWNDSELNIPWPIENPIISEKDKRLLSLDEFRKLV